MTVKREEDGREKGRREEKQRRDMKMREERDVHKRRGERGGAIRR